MAGGPICQVSLLLAAVRRETVFDVCCQLLALPDPSLLDASKQSINQAEAGATPVTPYRWLRLVTRTLA